MKKIFLSTLICSLFSASAFASTDVHTWHTIYSKNGSWQGTLAPINENPYFVDQSGAPLSTFTITEQTPQVYGFGFGPNDNFDVAYTLTLTQNNPTLFTSRTCVFVITAMGPAQPDIKVLKYNGANCMYAVVSGVGENFYVS